MNMHILNSMLKHHEAEQKALAEKKFAQSTQITKKFHALFDKVKKVEDNIRAQNEKALVEKKALAERKARAEKALAEAQAPPTKTNATQPVAQPAKTAVKTDEKKSFVQKKNEAKKEAKQSQIGNMTKIQNKLSEDKKIIEQKQEKDQKKNIFKKTLTEQRVE